MTDNDDADWFERALRESADSEDDVTESDATTEQPTEDVSDPDSGGPSEEDSSLFEDDFSSALRDVEFPGDESTSPPDEMDLPSGSPDGEEFADEDPESEISRIELGIDGLDAMIRGGIPEQSLITTIGSAGSGKTTFGLQFLNQGLQQGERGVFITLEESKPRVVRSATEKGFPYDEYIKDGRLAIVDIDAVDMAHSLQSIRSDLPRLINDFDASRLVLDSVSLLEMMFETRAERRNEIYNFTNALKEAGVTTMMTSEASDDNPYVSRYGIVEYLTDAVFILQYIRPKNFEETRMGVEIQKIRDAHHSRETKPYEISDTGISVYQRATIF